MDPLFTTARPLEMLQRVDEQTHPVAGAALGDLGLGLVGERRPGDVDVRPRRPLLDELGEEQGGGDRATVGAGSTITKDVEDDALAVARGRQMQKMSWPRPKKQTDSQER